MVRVSSLKQLVIIQRLLNTVMYIYGKFSRSYVTLKLQLKEKICYVSTHSPCCHIIFMSRVIFTLIPIYRNYFSSFAELHSNTNSKLYCTLFFSFFKQHAIVQQPLYPYRKVSRFFYIYKLN